MPFGVPLEVSRQLSGFAVDDVADVVVFGTWLGTDLIAGYHVVGPPAGILTLNSSAPEANDATFINARLIGDDGGGLNEDDSWLTEFAELSSSRTALLKEELVACIADTDFGMAQPACG